jgi:RNA polymerase sigma-70 factor, ECF subfamily
MRVRDPLKDPEPLLRNVYSYVAYRIGAGPDAEDVTSEVFERALRYRESYDPAKGTPLAWLVGIARRLIEATAPPSRGETIDGFDAPASVDLEEEAIRRVSVVAAVAELDERDRELIALRYGADLSARQIAQRLELSTNAVDVALHRARMRLRAELEGRAADEEDSEPSADRHVRNSVPRR